MSGIDDPKSKPIPLREWCKRILETTDISALANESFTSPFGADSSSWPADIRRSLTVSSHSYLTSALKIARSLADQVCQVEKYDEGQHLLPAPGHDWADRVVIHLFSPQKSCSDPKELHDMLNCLIPAESLSVKDDDVEGTYKADSEEDVASYHAVARAEILPSPNDYNVSLNNKTQHKIYSLGVVYYEIFSGGERYLTPQINSKPQAMHESDGIKADGREPIPHDQAGTFFDLAGELTILDGIEDAGGLLGNIDSQLLDNVEEQKPNKKKGPQICTTRSVSVESLKSKGLPWSLCSLIANMIGCASGDLSLDESYRHMSDVCSDLQRMLDKPRIYLDDLDLAKLSVAGLRLNETIFGRETEFASLQGAYKRSISGESELAIISGLLDCRQWTPFVVVFIHVHF